MAGASSKQVLCSSSSRWSHPAHLKEVEKLTGSARGVLSFLCPCEAGTKKRSRFGGTPPNAPRALRRGSGQAWASPPLPLHFSMPLTGHIHRDGAPGPRQPFDADQSFDLLDLGEHS